MTDRINCNEPTPIVILCQGEVVVDSATVLHRSERMAVVEIHCDTKYANLIVGHRCSEEQVYSAAMYFYTSHDAIRKHPTATGSTEVLLTEFQGWRVEINENYARYSFRVLFVKGGP